jgi:uncharacterized protein YndB with AHSA1/START domain
MPAKPTPEAAAPQPLVLSRRFHARPATVFRAWTAAEHVQRWFCPEGFSIPEARVELREGGPFELCMRSPAGEQHWIRGRFQTVVPDSRLVIAMLVTDDAGRELFRADTEVTLSEALGGTLLELVQRYTLIDPAVAWMMAGAPEGWRTTLEKLEREVMRLQAGDGTTRSVAHATFHLERRYDAPAARVWRALTDPAAKAVWFPGSPAGLEVLERRMDLRVGGSEFLSGRWEGGVVSTFDALYHDVIPLQRLVYSYTMHLDAKKISVSLATLQLQPDGGGTRLLVTEQGAFLDGYDDAGSREHGTGLLLDALGAALRG